MIELVLPPDARPPRAADAHATPQAHAHELWRLRGATDDLRGLAVETSFGYALGLELATEVVWLQLQPSLDALVTTAERLETALRAQGWVPVGSVVSPIHKECS